MNPKEGFRRDIQGLRAIAVLFVLIYHVFPDALPGGFVGVDIFFVVSGYLITGLLVREFNQRQSIDYVRFYSRRFWRLTPAAVTVLLTCLLFIPVLPEHRWLDTAYQIIASALYFENWYLALQAVDYLNQDALPSPVQHFWSLSVEEQFYIIFPPTILLLALAARRFKLSVMITLLVALSLLALASFLYSAVSALNDNWGAGQYFYSHGRFWEILAGGLLAIYAKPIQSQIVSSVLYVLGLALMLASAVMITAEMAFPGYVAIFPVSGAVCVILAGMNKGLHGTGLFFLSENRLSTWLGDISYSVYLWHWPIIIYYIAYTGADISLLAGILIICVSLALSHLTKVLIEDRFRQVPRPGLLSSNLRSFAGGSALTVSCALAGVAFAGYLHLSSARMPSSFSDYPGALSISDRVSYPAGLDPYPSPVQARLDLASVYSHGCHGDFANEDLTPCRYGNSEADFSVTLVGDSNAANWVPAFEQISSEQDWYLTVHTKAGCPLLMDTLTNRIVGTYDSCREWGERVFQALESNPPDLLIIAISQGYRLDGDYSPKDNLAKLRMSAERTIERLEAMGLPIVIMGVTPNLRSDPLDCYASNPECQFENVNEYFLRLPFSEDFLSSRVVVRMNDLLCPDGSCPTVIGNVMVWRDKTHFTATYSRSMARELTRRLSATGLVPRISDISGADKAGRRSLAFTLNCEALGPVDPINRVMHLDEVSDNIFEYELQITNDRRMETWRLEITDDRVDVTGVYKEGSTDLKDIRLQGAISDETLSATGLRGPRNCQIEGRFPF